MLASLPSFDSYGYETNRRAQDSEEMAIVNRVPLNLPFGSNCGLMAGYCPPGGPQGHVSPGLTATIAAAPSPPGGPPVSTNPSQSQDSWPPVPNASWCQPIAESNLQGYDESKHGGTADSGHRGVKWEKLEQSGAVFIQVDGRKMRGGRFAPKNGSTEEIEKARLRAISRRHELEHRHFGCVSCTECFDQLRDPGIAGAGGDSNAFRAPIDKDPTRASADSTSTGYI